jgi:branched-chain amino acid aminotransferase
MKVILNSELVSSNGRGLLESGWLTGDGVFETIKTVINLPYSLTRHLDRARLAAHALEIPMPAREEIEVAVDAILSNQGFATGILRISFGRDGQWLVAHMPYEEITTAAKIRLHPELIDGHQHKIFPYSERLDILHQARAAGFDDALVCNKRELISEGSVTNFIAQIDGQWITPPISDGALPGIMRGILLENNLVVERSISRNDIMTISSAFLLSSLRIAQAVESIEGRSLHLSLDLGAQIHALAVKYSVG